MSDLYLHDIEDGESPDAYMHMKWLTHHRYLVPVEPETTVTTDGTAPVFIGLEAGKYLIFLVEADDE